METPLRTPSPALSPAEDELRRDELIENAIIELLEEASRRPRSFSRCETSRATERLARQRPRLLALCGRKQ